MDVAVAASCATAVRIASFDLMTLCNYALAVSTESDDNN
jgi:hypothetical protein